MEPTRTPRRRTPPELVDQILSFLFLDGNAEQKTFSACALVSHSWLPLVRSHRYESFHYTLDLPENYQTYAHHRYTEKFRSLPILIKTFETFPTVPLFIRKLKLSISHRLDPYLASHEIFGSDTDEEDCEKIPSRHIPWQYTEAPKFSLDLLLELLQCVTGLRALSLPSDILKGTSSIVVIDAVFSKLRRLEISTMVHDDYITVSNLQSVLALYGTVCQLSLSNVFVREDEDEVAVQLPLPQTVISHFTAKWVVDNPFTPLYAVLAELPAAHLITRLDLPYIAPANMAELRVLIDRCSTNIEYFAFQVTSSLSQSFAPSFSLDLSNCRRLLLVSLKIQHILLDDTIVIFPAVVTSLLAQYIETRLPSGLPCLDLKCNDMRDQLDKSSANLAQYHRADDLLLQAIRNGRMQRISISPWELPCFSNTLWEDIALLFPRLVEDKLLVQHNGLPKLASVYRPGLNE